MATALRGFAINTIIAAVLRTEQRGGKCNSGIGAALTRWACKEPGMRHLLRNVF